MIYFNTSFKPVEGFWLGQNFVVPKFGAVLIGLFRILQPTLLITHIITKLFVILLYTNMLNLFIQIIFVTVKCYKFYSGSIIKINVYIKRNRSNKSINQCSTLRNMFTVSVMWFYDTARRVRGDMKENWDLNFSVYSRLNKSESGAKRGSP